MRPAAWLTWAALAFNLLGVIVANLVPSVPFVVLTTTPFVEQIDTRIESAARMYGARTSAVLTRILAPLLVPGILAASMSILVLVPVRTVGMFEPTSTAAGPDSETVVVSLFYSVPAAGIRARQTVDAMAVICTASMPVLPVVALRFVNPTRLVTRIEDDDQVSPEVRDRQSSASKLVGCARHRRGGAGRGRWCSVQ